MLAPPSDAAGPSARVVLRQVDATHDSSVVILRDHVRSVRNDGGLVVEVPLSCLGDPSRIRLGVETWGIVPYPEVNPTGEAISYDDAFRTGPSSTARAAQRRDRLYAGRGYGTMSAAFDLR